MKLIAKPTSRIITGFILLLQSKFCWKINDRIYFTSKFYYRSNQQRCSMKKGVLRSLTKFTGIPVQERLFAGLSLATVSVITKL